MDIEELHKEARKYCERYFNSNFMHPSYDVCYTAFINGAKLEQQKSEKLYNEEDLKNIIKKVVDKTSPLFFDVDKETLTQELFNEFKK